jgi:hypothetical protein
MAFVVYLVALILTVLTFRVLDLAFTLQGDWRIAVFLAVVWLWGALIGVIPWPAVRVKE